MKIEYEATFFNIKKDEVRKKLKKIGAELLKPEVLMRRVVFEPPKHIDKNNGYIRVRDEGYGKITMTFKIQDKGAGIETEKESEIEIKSFNDGVQFLIDLGYKKKSEQESLRELWKIDNVEIMIDTWPFTETYIEIEGKNEENVRKIVEKLGFDWKDAHFGPSMARFISKKYGISENDINNKIPIIKFNTKNPFLEFLENKK